MQFFFNLCSLPATYIRCVESGVQSGRYLAPISRAFSLSSPLNGFWKPLRTNTTPSMIRFNGTCCAPRDFAFCCLGLGSDLDWVSLFLSADFCTMEAGRDKAESYGSFLWGNKLYVKIQTLRLSVTFCSTGAGCAGRARLVFGSRSFALRWASWAYFLGRGRSRGRLPLFAELKFSFCWWLSGNN